MLDVIRTRRLELRPFELADARRVAYLAGDYDVAKMCGRVPHPYSYQAAQAWMQLVSEMRDNGDEFAFAVTIESDGLIGSCGVNRRGDPETGLWEIGYWFGLPYWGEGYASEAAEAVMWWAREVLEAKIFAANHFADNPASGKVLRKLGFSHVGTDAAFGLARQRISPIERYVWPESARAVKLPELAEAHRLH
jgi:RimJ/RimL family protein N-acetyltransferase